MSQNHISFYINGKNYTVSDPDPSQSLNNWIRKQPKLSGTKLMCDEGGCGCCVVALQRPSQIVKAVNSCLVPLCSVDGCNVTTVEGVGSQRTGFDRIQSLLAQHGGSQCGYCTPGFVMSMHSLLEEDESPPKQTIEDNFDGNLCRCTGYRSILDAMKCFACDADDAAKEMCKDIEDLASIKCRTTRDRGDAVSSLKTLRAGDDVSTWIRPSSFDELKDLMKNNPKMFRLVCGNTGTGIYKLSSVAPAYYDISRIPDLNVVKKHPDSIEIGAGTCLNDVITVLSENRSDSVTFDPIADHIRRVATKPVRNIGSWAGNLMLKHSHNEFPSDVSVLLEGADAKVVVYDVTTDSSTQMPVFGNNGFINCDMNAKVITSVLVPYFPDNGQTSMKTFKIMPRSQNAHAYVNAAFRCETDQGGSKIDGVVAVFGGISPDFARAEKTEEYLAGKVINSEATLKGALTVLFGEVQVYCHDNYKCNLALGLFYKFYLSLCDQSLLGPGIASGLSSLVRPISSGRQTFKSDPTTFPISESIPKLSGILQASGEASYISDHPSPMDELHCACVLSEVANADIDVIDTSQAEKMPGFVNVISKNNFPPGVKNTYLFGADSSQTIIATDHVQYAGQIVAVVVAESAVEAERISKAVKVSYKNQKKPILTIDDAIASGSIYPLSIPDFEIGNPDSAIGDAKHVVTGECTLGLQYHFYMETQVCRVTPTEEGGFNLEASTQTQQTVQQALSYSFSIPNHKIEVTTKRLGGAYGGKATNSLIISSVAALAAYVTMRPVRLHADLRTCMSALGSRTPYKLKYKLGFDDDGIMAGVDCELFTNSGCSSYDGEADDDETIVNWADSAYFCPNRRYKRRMCRSNLPSTTWCRAPSSLQMTAFADLMLEHAAYYLGADPIDVKYANLYKHGQPNLNGELLLYCNLRGVYDELLSKYEIKKRQEEIATFNKANKWKKKGLAVTPMKYRVSLAWPKYGVLLSVYAVDGTVVVSHGGVECGQGINTKVCQAVAYRLGIPIDLVMVQRTSTITSPNSLPTGGSTTSESTCQSAIACCDILNARLKPVRETLPDDVKWAQLIAQCDKEHIDLSVYHMNPPAPDSSYSSFGVTSAEVEYDVITGEHQILQVDTIFDCGISLNPSVDLGQIEGAFVMGIGFWLSEQMLYDENNGRLLTDGTWEYKPPASKDIPIQWNIDLLKDAPNPLGILRSKACGEPPMCMSLSVAIAMKRAVEATRRDRGIADYFPMPTPSTVEATHNSALLNPVQDFTLH